MAIKSNKKTISKILVFTTFLIFLGVYFFLYPKVELFYLNSYIYNWENSILVITISIMLSSIMAFVFFDDGPFSFKQKKKKKSNKIEKFFFNKTVVYSVNIVIFFTMMPPSITVIIPLGVNLLDDRGTVEKQFFVHRKRSLGYNKTDNSYLLLGQFEENNGSPMSDSFVITREKYRNLKSKDEITLELTKGLLGVLHSAQISEKSFKNTAD